MAESEKIMEFSSKTLKNDREMYVLGLVVQSAQISEPLLECLQLLIKIMGFSSKTLKNNREMYVLGLVVKSA